MLSGIPLKPVYTPRDPAEMYIIIAASEAGETMGECASMNYQHRS